MNAQKHFGTNNLYKILEIDSSAKISDGIYNSSIFIDECHILLPSVLKPSFYFIVKKNYYRLARKFHPDRVSAEDKSIAKEKFSIIHQAYEILSDTDKRQHYDNGNGNDVLFTKATRSAEWEHFLKPASDHEIRNVRSNYQNSVEEENCIAREYQTGKGSLTHIINHVPFTRIEDEPRIVGIIKRLIVNGQVPKYKIKKIK